MAYCVCYAVLKLYSKRGGGRGGGEGGEGGQNVRFYQKFM